MKVQKSSAECAERNLTVQAEIDLGLSEAWEPSDSILAQEAEAKKREEAGFKLAASKKEVLISVGCNNHVADGSRYGSAGDVKVEIDEVRTSGGRFSMGYISGWRLYIGDRYGSEKGSWVGIGDGATLGINTKQLEKAKAKIAEEQSRINTKKAERAVKQNAEQRTAAFIAANLEFCKMAGHSSFNDGVTIYGHDRRAYYQTAFIFNEDGTVKIGGETLTVAQWTEIFNLRASQAAAMKSLKESFKNISPAS
jgi:hypothetical protein